MEWNGYVIYLVLSIHELKEMEMSERDHVLFSNITKIAVYPSDVGSCSMKSIEMDSHGHVRV